MESTKPNIGKVEFKTKQYKFTIKKDGLIANPIILPTFNNTILAISLIPCQCHQCQNNNPNIQHNKNKLFEHVLQTGKIKTQYKFDCDIFYMLSQTEIMLIFDKSQEYYQFIFWDIQKNKINKTKLTKQGRQKANLSNIFYFHQTKIICLTQKSQISKNTYPYLHIIYFQKPQLQNIDKIEIFKPFTHVDRQHKSKYIQQIKLNNKSSTMFVISLQEYNRYSFNIFDGKQCKKFQIPISEFNQNRLKDVWQLKSQLYFMNCQKNNFLWNSKTNVKIPIDESLSIAKNIHFVGHFMRIDRMDCKPIYIAKQFYPLTLVDQKSLKIVHIIQKPYQNNFDTQIGILDYEEFAYIQGLSFQNSKDKIGCNLLFTKMKLKKGKIYIHQ